jgi:hypothetical protein
VLIAHLKKVLSAQAVNIHMLMAGTDRVCVYTQRKVFMKDKGIFWGTLIIGIAFGLVVAGCASSGGANGPTTAVPPTATGPAAGAVQLAADINAIEADSATVSGTTVTLAGRFVWLQTDLTVPLGVTLDVTAGGARLGLGSSAGDRGGGVSSVDDDNVFIMEGGRIQGNTDSDGFTKNTAVVRRAALHCWPRGKWGMGGAYTRGGVPQIGGSDIVEDNSDNTNDTLIAVPGK